MPHALEHWGKGKAIVVNTQTGKHFSKSPIPLANAQKQLRLLRGVAASAGEMKPRKSY